MKQKIFIFSLVVLTFLLVAPTWAPQDQKRDIQAILVKVINNVDKNVPSKGWTKALTADQLRSGYEVRTQEKSVAVIQFSDLSKLIVREKSIAQIKGEMQGKEILERSVHMTKGDIKFDVKKGEKEQFRFTSPIAVASIRGTSGTWGQTDSISTYTMLTGMLTVMNLQNNRSEEVRAGQTAITDRRGNITVRQSTKNEKNDAQQNDDQKQKTKHQLKITGVDADGKAKTIILEWEE